MKRMFNSLVPRSNLYRLLGASLTRRLVAALAVVAVVLALASVSWAVKITTTNPVVDFNDHSIVYGSATLTRKHDRVIIELTASNLVPGVYTIWWGVTNPGEDLTAGWNHSRVVGHDGTIHVSADLSVGEILTLHPLSGGSLEDPQHADIIMVMRYHGPVDPQSINDQRHSFQPESAVNALITIHNAP
jgi:hypothetical protein